MTIAALHRILDRYIAAGSGRARVCVDKESFTHPLEADGCRILDVHMAEVRHVLICDDDGGIKQNKDGTEASRTCFVLYGCEGIDK